MTWRLGPEWDIDGVSVLLVGVAFQAVPKVTVLVSSEPAITTSARSVPAGAVCVSPVAQEPIKAVSLPPTTSTYADDAWPGTVARKP